jgi:hypothetical protein
MPALKSLALPTPSSFDQCVANSFVISSLIGLNVNLCHVVGPYFSEPADVFLCHNPYDFDSHIQDTECPKNP